MIAFLFAAALLAVLAMALIVPALWQHGGARGMTLIAPAAVLGLATTLYIGLGTPTVFNAALMTTLQAEAMVKRLSAHMEKDPANREGWLLLARSQALLSHHKESAQAYARLAALGDLDPALTEAYAEELAHLVDKNDTREK